MTKEKEKNKQLVKEEIAKKPFLAINRDGEKRRSSASYFLRAIILITAVYATELFYLIEEPLFGWIYYGNITRLLSCGATSILITVIMIVFHKVNKRLFNESPFFLNKGKKITVTRRAVIYAMTVLPVLITAIALGFKFKLVVNLGEQITLFTLLENLGTMLNASLKILSAVYVIFLIECGSRNLFDANEYIPFGGIVCAIFYGLTNLFLVGGAFAWLNLALFLYYGVVYIVSEGRFAVTYLVAVILFIL